MLVQSATPQMVAQWKAIWCEYRDRLRPNRRSGGEVVAYLREKYPLRELHDNAATRVVTDNVLHNAYLAMKLPANTEPTAVAFIVEQSGTGATLYLKQDEVFKGNDIFAGVDLSSGCFFVEGSSLLHDELRAFQGLDAKDIQNYFLVAEYISSLRRFDLLERIVP
ncbi:MAG: hypothetical protein GX600_05765 [Dehalococcoidia bacterium]|nr:hypothetical protein [Dehalococcoidia bacterium]